MDVLKPASQSAAQPAGSTLALDRPGSAAPISAAAPRPDLPPVTRMDATAATAPRPPDQLGLGLVQAARLADHVPASVPDPLPEHTLKPWGIAILPDSDAIEARREAEIEAETRAEAEAEAARQDETRDPALPAEDPEDAPPLASPEMASGDAPLPADEESGPTSDPG